MIVIVCGECGGRFDVPDHVGGGSARCPRCGALIPVASVSPPYRPTRRKNDSPVYGTVALVFGILSMASAVLVVNDMLIFAAFLAVPFSLAGLVLGIAGIRSRKRGRAIVAVVLCGLHLSFLALLAWGIYESLS